MIAVVTTLLVLLAAAALAARYGSDSRAGGDPSGRDPAWPRTPARTHSPSGDLRRAAVVTTAWARRIAARRRAWAAFDHARRVWEGA